MAQNYWRVHNNIMSEIVAESARENQGVPQLWKKYPVELIQYPDDPRTELLIFPKADVDYTIPLYEFMVPILPKLGFFVLLMRAPSTWGQRRLRPDVKLLYRKSDMYLKASFIKGSYTFSVILICLGCSPLSKRDGGSKGCLLRVLTATVAWRFCLTNSTLVQRASSKPTACSHYMSLTLWNR